MTDNNQHQEFIALLKQAIMEHAEQLYMPQWMTGAEEVSELGVCGTTLCIGGTACILSGDVIYDSKYSFTPYIVTTDGRELSIVDRARELLEPIRDSLFDYQYWPEDLQLDYRCASTAIERAAVACQAIDYYCKTGDFA